MIRISDYMTPEGKTDWKAYDQARKDSGEACYKCGHYILFGKGYRQMCDACTSLHRGGRGEVYSNRSGIRCPKCGFTSHDPYDFSDDIYQEGTHELTCSRCDHEFEVETHVEYSWTSPAMIEEDEDEDEESEDDEDDDEVDDSDE